MWMFTLQYLSKKDLKNWQGIGQIVATATARLLFSAHCMNQYSAANHTALLCKRKTVMMLKKNSEEHYLLDSQKRKSSC